MPRQQKQSHDTHPIVILRAPTVVQRSGLTRRTIDRRVAQGTFPAPLRLGPQSVGWVESEVNAWLASRPRTKGTEPQANEPSATLGAMSAEIPTE